MSRDSPAEALRRRLTADPEPGDVVDHVALEVVEHQVAVVTLARPDKKNALSLASWRRLDDIFRTLAADRSLRVVVVRGMTVFGAGADIAEFPELRMTPADAVDYNEAIAAALTRVQELTVPVIAMVRGLAVGGGCELAAACDVRVVEDGARFGIPIGRLGVTLGYTEARAVARLIGSAQLKRLLFGGELIDAAEATRIGLADICVPADDLVERVISLVEAARTGSAVTMAAAKAVADMTDRALTAADTELLTRITVAAYGGPDLREGVAAFLGRRAPDFRTEEESSHGRS